MLWQLDCVCCWTIELVGSDDFHRASLGAHERVPRLLLLRRLVFLAELGLGQTGASDVLAQHAVLVR